MVACNAVSDFGGAGGGDGRVVVDGGGGGAGGGIPWMNVGLLSVCSLTDPKQQNKKKGLIDTNSATYHHNIDHPLLGNDGVA